jgi:hypothetical protein
MGVWNAYGAYLLLGLLLLLLNSLEATLIFTVRGRRAWERLEEI